MARRNWFGGPDPHRVGGYNWHLPPRRDGISGEELNFIKNVDTTDRVGRDATSEGP